MDTTSKLFIFMIVLALIIGAFVIKFKPRHNLETVYKSNAGYYPHINDDTVLRKIRKPTVEANDRQPARETPGTPSKTGKKTEGDEFVPD